MANNLGFNYEQSPSPRILNRRSGRADMTGELFEVGVATLTFFRAVFETDGFQLATNVEGLADFDDLFLKYTDRDTKREHVCFLQLKHKESKPVTYNSLIALNGDFSLIKYYDSWCEVQNMLKSSDNFLNVTSSDVCEFVLYTNAEFNLNKNYDRMISEECDEILLINSSYERKPVKFKLKMHQELESYRKSLLKISSSQMNEKDIIEELNKFKDLKFCQRLLKLTKYQDEFNKMMEQQISYTCKRETWEEFLNQLKIYSNQASVQLLDDLIKQEIVKYFGTKEKKTEEIFSKLKQGTINWWRDGRTYLTSNYAPFWNLLLREHFSDLTTPLYETLEGTSELQFKNLPDIPKTGNIVHIKTQGSIKLCCLRVHKWLQELGYLMLDSTTLNSRLAEVITFWKYNEWCNVLVIVDCTNILEIILEISNVLTTNPKKKLVLIMNENVDLQNVLHDKLQIHSYMDKFSLNELDEDSQNNVMEQKINFQGNIISLQSLIKEPNLVTCDIIDSFVSRNEVNVGCEVKDLDEFYIPRKLLRRECMDENIVLTTSEANFAVSGLSQTEMEKLLQSVKDVGLLTNKSQDDYKFTIINNEADYRKLCESNEQVHWIHKTESNFVWRNSKRDIKLIKNCLKLDSNHVIYNSGKDLLNIPQQTILITAEPGMGKTTELSHIAKEIKEEDPTTWVIKINLSDYTEDLNQDATDLTKLLVKAAHLNTAFERSLFDYEMKHKGNIVVMFDSFDEICPNYTEKVINILKELLTFKVKKVFVTSRPGLRDKLEQELSTLSFVLKAFSKEDKVIFLNSLCKMHLNDSSSQLHKFINDLLELTSTSINDSMHTFASTPLETMMLFEVFKTEALNKSSTGEVSMLQNLDILKLYELFLDRKQEIFFKKYKLDMSNLGVSEYYQELRKIFVKNHMICSLVAILDDDILFNKLHNSETITRKYLQFLEKLTAAKERTGILTEVLNDKPVFIHRTFAEYFVGLWLSKNFEFNRELIKQLFFNSRFEIVRMFFDRILARHSRLHTAVLNLDKDLVHSLLSTSQVNVNEKDEGGRTALHNSIMKYNDRKLHSDEKYRELNFEIISILLNHGADPNIEDGVFCWRPLRLADEMEICNVIGLLLRKTTHTSDLQKIESYIFDDNNTLSVILLEAAEGGYVEFVEHLLKFGVHVDHKIYSATGIYTMLHMAAKLGHFKLVQYLVDQGADIEFMDSFHEKTSLMCAVQNGHNVIAEFLIERGAYVNVVDRHGNNELILAAMNGNCQLMNKFLSLGMDINFRNKKSETPLLIAIRHDRCEAMRLLLQFGADINIRDEEGNTPLHYAAKFGGNKCLSSLLQNDFEDVDISNNNLETPIMVAVRSKMWYAVELLLKHGADVNTSDRGGNSVIHYAAKYGDVKFVNYLLASDINKVFSSSNMEEFAIIAAKYGNWDVFKQLSGICNGISITDQSSTSILHYAVDTGDEYIENLVNSGYDINCKDGRNETPLLRAARKKKWNVLKQLLKFRADTKVSDVDGNNALFHVCEAGEISYVKSLIDLGIDVNSRNAKNETPLTAATRKKHLNVCRLLEENGADMTIVDVDGNSVMHHLVNSENAEFLNDIISEDININADTEYLKHLIILGLNVNLMNSKSESPLLIAARNGRWDMVHLLIEHGADLSQCDDKGNSIMHHIIIFGNLSTMDTLLKLGPDVNIRNKAQETPILRAAKLRKWDLVNQLLMHGADGSECDGDGNGILHYAIEDVHVDNNELIELLDCHLDVNIRNSELETPILKAAKYGKWNLVKLLSFYGADVKTIDVYGNTLNKYALENESIQYLTEVLNIDINEGASEQGR